MPRHAPGDRMDGELDLDIARLQQLHHLLQRMLGLGHRHAVARHHDDAVGILHPIDRILDRSRFDALLGRDCTGAFAAAAIGAEAAEDHVDDAAVHRPAHDVREDGAGESQPAHRR